VARGFRFAAAGVTPPISPAPSAFRPYLALPPKSGDRPSRDTTAVRLRLTPFPA
jgi:hypothetical protein